MNNVIALIQQIYNVLGVQQTASSGDLIGLALCVVLLLGAIFFLLAKGDSSPVEERAEQKVVEKEEEKKDSLEAIPTKDEAPKKEEAPKVSWMERLTSGLSRSRQEVWGRFESIFSGGKLNEEKLEELEELLYSSDMGPEMVTELIEEISNSMDKEEMHLDGFKKYLYSFLEGKMGDVQQKVNQELYTFDVGNRAETPKVIMVVGVNGAGKTTTIGKLATKLRQQGAQVVVGACDTFRAAAVDQLEVWCQRAEVEMVRAKEGTNPSGVAYDALQKAINSKADYCILDTAGRLHTAENLMEELKKMKRVLTKLDETAPHETLLVIDAVTGQNAMRQAEEFNQALNLSGLIFTKCDGSSKAGGAIGIINKLQVPITYIGVGESVEDLNIFNQKEYLSALLDMQ